MLEELSSSFVFYLTAGLGIIISVVGFFTSSKLEESAQQIIAMTLKDRTKMTFKEIWYGLKIKQARNMIIFIIISRGFIPSYSNYFYYFLTDELGFTQIQYATLYITSALALLICIYFYNLWFSDKESSCMLGVSCIFAALGNFNALMLSRGNSFGIDPTVFAYLTGPVTDSID